ncbi:MAG: hypothetical protein U0326_22710 [Polyangiales bacterium]
MSARTMLLAILLAACQRSAPEPSHPTTLAPTLRGAHHEDPSAPFELAVSSRPLDARTAEVKLRLVPRTELPAVSLGVDLTQSVALASGEARRSFASARAGAPIELTLVVRRVADGASGVTLRAWAEARGEAVVLGDEQPFTLFGEAPAEQSPAREQIVRAPDGSLLHDTIIE